MAPGDASSVPRPRLVAGPVAWAAVVAAVAFWLVLVGPDASAETALVSVASPHGQLDYRVVQWTTADGLPQNSVTDMAFLPNGEVWLATFGGLVRFDGHGFDVLDTATDEALPTNRIVALAVTGAGSLLFLTQHGHLGRVADGRCELLVPPPVSPIETLDLLVDRDGWAFCKSEDGRIWHTDGTHPWQPVLSSARGHGTLNDLALDEGGDAWGTWGDRLVRITGGQPGDSVTLHEQEVMLSPRAGGGLWLGLQGGMGRWVDGRLDRLEVRPAFDKKVAAVEAEGKETLWVAGGEGLSHLDRQSDGSWLRTSFPLQKLRTAYLNTLQLDATGAVWVGTAGSGLYRLNRVPVRRFSAESGLREIGALVGDGDGGAFAASGCRQLFHLHRSGSVSTLRLDVPNQSRRLAPCSVSLAPGPDDSVWVRSGPSLFLVQRGVFEARLVTSVAPNYEGPVVPKGDGSIWIVSRDGTVQLLSPGGEVVRELSLPSPLIGASRGPDGDLWIGGDGEVFRVGQNSTQRFGPEENVPRGRVRDILAETDGTVWIGTYGGGIGRLRAGRVARLTVDQGLPDNSVSRILDDGRGRLWISTNRGLAVAEKADLEAVAEGRARGLVPVVLGTERGIAEANFGSPAGFADAGGWMWLGTIDGAVAIDAAAFPFNATPPAVRVRQVQADGRSLPLDPRVRVPPLTERLRIGFAAVAPLYPEQTRFRFRVDGIDDDWVDVGAQRTVDWSPPGPGHYLFRVEARNEDGIWSSAPATVELDVRPAWWQTRTFWTAVFVALALAGALEVRRQIRRVERRHAEELRTLEEQRDAEARTASLRAQLEHVSRAALAGELAASLAHEVRQPIGAIVNNAEAGRRNLEQYLQRPAELEQVLGDIVADGRRASEVVQGLRGFLKPADPKMEPVDLSGLVGEMLPLVRRELEDNRVEVELALADDLPLVEGLRVQLGQIVVNLVVNACEALARRDGRRKITLATGQRDGRVELVVSDNGPGLDEAVAARVFEPFVTTKPEGLGVGLSICRSIAERHGGHLSAEAAPGGGIRMTLTLPTERPSGGQP